MFVRFTILVLVAMVAAVTAIAIDTWWALALATLALLALLAQLVVIVFHYTSASGHEPDDDALEEAGLVEKETALPTRRRWNLDTAREYAADVDRLGLVDVPARWRGPHGDVNILLVATDRVDADVVRTAAGDGRDVAVLVVVPTVAPTATRFRLGDGTAAVAHAQGLLQDIVATLRAAGLRADGHIGAADPAVAVSDGLRTYDADRVIVARRRTGRLRHLEDVPVEAAAETFGVPLEETDLSALGATRA